MYDTSRSKMPSLDASSADETDTSAQSTHGYFTLPGLIDRPYIYTITPISDTRTMCQRSVSVRQPLSASTRADHDPFPLTDADKPLSPVRFHMIISFKRSSPAISAHQPPSPLPALSASLPADSPDCPDVDTPWYARLIARYPQTRTFPGLDVRKADMRGHNADAAPGDYRQLNYYRLKGRIPRGLRRAENLHAAAHLYASDRNSLFLISHALGFGDQLAKIASLGHSVVFHTDGEGLVMEDEPEGEDARGWWVQEAWTGRSEGGRGMHESRIWSPEGVHVATTWQDGLVKKAEGGREGMFGKFIEMVKEEEGEGAGDWEEGRRVKFGRRREVKL